MNEGLNLALQHDVAKFHLAVFELREEFRRADVLNLDDVPAGGRLHGVNIKKRPYLRTPISTRYHLSSRIKF